MWDAGGVFAILAAAAIYYIFIIVSIFQAKKEIKKEIQDLKEWLTTRK